MDFKFVAYYLIVLLSKQRLKEIRYYTSGRLKLMDTMTASENLRLFDKCMKLSTTELTNAWFLNGWIRICGH